ncbi:hypothetical protein CEXT_305991 [Caerostris extrusa]|uniref:Uncharacterized protein n=1 Tax=Caerostris extrusa TaxID=172846 RepID=A0AAV4N835_CAEEX|nr:hypothetical protein CEXT_305991 [Caerostris extrusa]
MQLTTEGERQKQRRTRKKTAAKVCLYVAVRAAETDDQRERRLESRRLQHKRDRERETPEQKEGQTGKTPKVKCTKRKCKKDNGDAIPVEPTVVVKKRNTSNPIQNHLHLNVW